MKSIIIILLLYAFPGFSQKLSVFSTTGGSTAAWQTGNESSVMNYEVQDSVPGKTWVSFTNPDGSVIEIPKGQSSYTYQLPVNLSAWVRIRAVGSTDFYTNAIYVSSNNVTISNVAYHTTSLTWTASNEVNVNYYLIQKSNSGKTTQVTKYTARGGGNYTYRMARTMKKYTYTIKPFYKDGTSGPITNFK